MASNLDALWKAALEGDDAALKKLFRHAIRQPKNTVDGRGLRRLAAESCLTRGKQLRQLADEVPEPDASRLRRRATRMAALAWVAREGNPVTRRQRLITAVRSAAWDSLLDPAPTAPRNVIAGVFNLVNVDVSWVPPTNTYGIPLKSYTIRAYDALNNEVDKKNHAANLATTFRFTGLPAPGPYTFRVECTNDDDQVSAASFASNAVTVGQAPLAAPTGVALTSAGSVLKASWNARAGATEYVVTLYDAADAPIPALQYERTPLLEWLYFGMPNANYKVGVRSVGLGGHGAEAKTAAFHAHALNVAGFTKLTPTLPAFSSDPLLLFDAPALIDVARVRRRLTHASAQGSKWRYEYLKQQAIRLAQDTAQFESYVAQLMQMAVGKVQAAQLLSSPVFQEIIGDIDNDVQDLQNLASSNAVNALITRLAKEASTALLLQGILFWLLEYNPMAFWKGLFNNLIDDVSARDSDLTNTKLYVDGQFNAGSPFVNAVKALATELQVEAAAQINAAAAPLRAAVFDVIAETSEVLKTVYGSFDMPLLMRPAGANLPDIPNVNPFQSAFGQLTTAVENLVTTMRNRVIAELNKVANATDGGLFKTIMVVYICLPLLAFLAISFAGGPVSAAALGAIVLLAAQQLIHLLAKWLTGPIMDKLEDAKATLKATLKELQQLFVRQTGIIENPKNRLELLSAHLLEVKNAIPAAFLNDAASLIDEVRRALMTHAQELGLAAERAMSFENATAFDVLRVDYDTRLVPAPQLPGGSDNSRLAGPRLIRDLNRLEVHRTKLLDGKELEVTYRASLFRLLGGTGNPVGAVAGGFAEFIKSRQLLVRLLQEDLVDANFPGMYRVLLSEVRLIGIFGQALALNQAVPLGIPVTLTHTGQSRTRVKRSANPVLPPLRLPGCLPSTAAAFVAKLLDPAAIGPLLTTAIARTAARVRYPYWRWTLTGIYQVKPPLNTQYRELLRDELGSRMADRTAETSCGAIDPGLVRKATIAFVDGIALNLTEWYKDYSEWSLGVWKPSEAERVAELTALGLGPAMIAALTPVATDAYNRIAREYLPRIAKWGSAEIVEESDPHVAALGFGTLVQTWPAESAVYNLLPGTQALSQNLSEPTEKSDAQSPSTAARSLQYRPFENRGIEGDLLLDINLGPNVTPPDDILLEITMRGCFDEDLAATVRASRRQNEAQTTIAKAVATAANVLLSYDGETPSFTIGAGNDRTIHFSARGYRNRLLRHAIAVAAAATTPGNADGLLYDAAFAALRRDDPLKWLTAPAGPLTLRLQFQKNAPTTMSELNTTLAITPDQLGIPDGLEAEAEGQIVAMGVAIIPMRPAATVGAVTPDGVLAPLFPPVVPKDRIIMTPEGTNPLSVATVLNAPSGVNVELTGPSMTNGDIYDVIFSVTIRRPVLQSRIGASGSP
jgi:hypothetical protein